MNRDSYIVLTGKFLVLYPRFGNPTGISNSSSFVYYSWESLFPQNMLKCAGALTCSLEENIDLWQKTNFLTFWAVLITRGTLWICQQWLAKKNTFLRTSPSSCFLHIHLQRSEEPVQKRMALWKLLVLFFDIKPFYFHVSMSQSNSFLLQYLLTFVDSNT